MPEAPLVLLIHLRNKIQPPQHPYHHYVVTLSCTCTSHCPFVPPHWGGGGGRQDVRPAGHQLKQRDLLNVLLHQKETDLSRCSFFKDSPALLQPLLRFSMSRWDDYKSLLRFRPNLRKLLGQLGPWKQKTLTPHI